MAIVMSVYGQGPSLAQTTKLPLKTPLTSGVVQGNSYKNSSLGLEFTPAPGLQFSTPEIKGSPGNVPLLVTVAAWGDGGTVFYADSLRYYPEDRRSTKAYVERVIRNQKKEGFDLVEGGTEGLLGGVTFARVDFKQTLSYEAVFVKACEAYAFVFIFASSDLASANTLIAKTSVKLDMENSGCGHASDSPPQKK